MIIYKFGDVVKEKGLIWALGSFDAIHDGHKNLLKNADATIIFDPLPESVFDSNFMGEVRSLNQRLNILKKIGIKVVIILDFSLEISKIKAKVFLDTFCNEVLPKKIVCGVNFRLGYKQEWDLDELKCYFMAKQIEFTSVDLVCFDFNNKNIVLSSSYVRNLVKQKEFLKIKNLLKEPYLLDLQFITPYLGETGWVYNLACSKQVRPPNGVYRTNFGDVVIENEKLITKKDKIKELEFLTCL